MTHPNDEFIADWLINTTEVRPVNSTGGPTSNIIKKLNLMPIVEPFLTFGNRWYLFADPNEFPAIEVSFLNGMEEPELFQKNPDAVRIGGEGRDDYGYEYDDISYKSRYDFGTAIAMYQGAYKGGT